MKTPKLKKNKSALITSAKPIDLGVAPADTLAGKDSIPRLEELKVVAIDRVRHCECLFRCAALTVSLPGTHSLGAHGPSAIRR